MFLHNRCPILALRIDGPRWRAAGHHSQIILYQLANIPPPFKQIVTWTRYRVLRAGMKVLVEFEAVLDVVCVKESKISCLTNSTASTVRATTERFSGMKEGEECHEHIN